MELRQRKFEVGDLVKLNWVYAYYAVITEVQTEVIHATITHTLTEGRSEMIGSPVNILKRNYDTIELLSVR